MPSLTQGAIRFEKKQDRILLSALRLHVAQMDFLINHISDRKDLRNIIKKILKAGGDIESHISDKLSDEEREKVKDILHQLMPLDTMVTDMWDWDIRFEDITFEDCFFDVALASEDVAMEQAEYLKNDIIEWINEFNMDYAQNQYDGNEFEKYILDQCKTFIIKWRNNIKEGLR